MKIALDLDGVLADLHGAMVEQTQYDVADFNEFGNWDDYDHFWSEARRTWREHTDDIEPVAPTIDRMTAQLAANHDVDIVTNTAGDDADVRAWLDSHDVVYDDVVRPPDDEYKDALDYDAFIDDNPYLCGDVSVLYLRDQRWNQSARGSGQYLYYSYEESYVMGESPLKPDPFHSSSPWVIRVTGLDDVLTDLDYQVEL